MLGLNEIHLRNMTAALHARLIDPSPSLSQHGLVGLCLVLTAVLQVDSRLCSWKLDLARHLFVTLSLASEEAGLHA